MIKILNKKGFTMVSVAIIVIVTMLLISTVAVSAVTAISNAKKMNFSTDIVYIQDEVDNYYIKSSYVDYPTLESVIVDLSNISEAIITEQFIGENITNDKVVLNEIDFDTLGIKKHVYGNNNTELDKYVVSTITGKVYYVAGIKAGGTTYYTIVPELNKYYKRNMESNSNEVAIDDVIFELSEIEFTNLPITVKVKLPVEYDYALTTPVIASNSKEVGTETAVGDYKEINVNTTGSDKNGNYSISVNYIKDEITKTVNYMVDNFDNTAPTIESTSQSSSINPSTEIFSAYLLLSVVLDDLSGIKNLKYAEENVLLVDAKSYFETKGKKVIDNKIEIKDYPIYTIYVEDNAGNYRVYNITIEENILVQFD